MTVDEAPQLMHEWTQSPALRVHMESVAACMGAYAEKLGPDQRGAVGRGGAAARHGLRAAPVAGGGAPVRGGGALAVELGVDEEILTAILGHAEYSGTPRTTPMAKALFAVDELAGFIVACARSGRTASPTWSLRA